MRVSSLVSSRSKNTIEIRCVHVSSRQMQDRYDVETAFYDQVYDTQDDISLYPEYCKKTGIDFLECCSETGRVTIPIARAGFVKYVIANSLNPTDSMTR